MSQNNLITRPGDDGYIVPGSPEYFDVIGASDVASICGHGYSTPNEVFMKKTHRAPPTEHKAIFDRGHAMEPLMAKMLEDKGRIIKSEQVQYRDPDRPWLIYHTDGMFPKWSPLEPGAKERKGPGNWEAKAPGGNMAAKFRSEGMAPSYVYQGQIGMHIAGMALGIPIEWGTAGFLDYDDWGLVSFDMDANWEFQKSVLEKLDHFHDCLIRDTPPDPMNNVDIVPAPVINGEIEYFTEGRVYDLSVQLAKLQPDLAMAKQADKAVRGELKDLLKGFTKIEVPGLIQFSYGHSKTAAKYDGPGLMEYCEYLVGALNDTIVELNDLNNGVKKEITFRRTDWFTPGVPNRTFKPTVIGE